MDFGLNLDPNQTDSFLQKMVGKLVDSILPVLKERLAGDELMTREELAAWLHVSPKSADTNFIFKSGFPYYMVGMQKRYWKRAVITWMDENQKIK